MTNDKGYIGKYDQWKPVKNRYIGVGGVWEKEKYKFIGVEGAWKLVFTDENIDLSAPFYLKYLESYAVQNENFLFMFGANFKDSQYVSPQVGGYFELRTDFKDVFENFTEGTALGGSLGTIADESAYIIGTDGDYFQLPLDPNTGINEAGIIGTDGTDDFVMSAWVYKPSSISGDTPLFSLGDKYNGFDSVITDLNEVQITSYVGQTVSRTMTSGLINVDAWNSVVLAKTNGVLNIYVNNADLLAASEGIEYLPATFNEVRVGSILKYTEVSETPRLSTERKHPDYTLGTSSKTVLKEGSGYQTVRSNTIIPENTGKYYFEIKVNNIPVDGTAWIGFSEPNSSVYEAVGIVGWSINSQGKIFQKETGGGQIWGDGTHTFATGDVIAVIYDSDLKNFTYYKNNTMMAIAPFEGVVGDLEVMLAGTVGVELTSQFDSLEFTYPIPADCSQLPDGTVYSNPVHTSQIGAAYRNVYAANDIALTDYNRSVLMSLDTTPKVVLTDGTNEYVVAPEWVLSITNKKVGITIPPTIPIGEYQIFIRVNGRETFKMPIQVNPVQLQETVFEDNFLNSDTIRNNYWMLHRQWGGANGGVVADNIHYDSTNQEVVIKANGDNYTGDVIGVNRQYKPKYHTHPDDPQVGMPWKNRVGGCMVYNEKTGYGSYEVEAKIPNHLGVCYAFWTFFYNEIYPTDPRYDEFLQGSVTEMQPNPDLQIQLTLKDGTYVSAVGDGAKFNRTALGTATFTQFDADTKASQFVGGSGYPWYSSGLNFLPDLTQSFSISIWVKANVAGGNNTHNNLIALGSGSESLGIQINYVNETTVAYRAAIRTDSATSISPWNVNKPYGEWTHITLSYDADATSGHMKTYQDGTLIDTQDKPLGNFTPINEWRILQHLPITGAAFTGNKDVEWTDLRIYNMAVNEAKVSQIYSNLGKLDTVEVQADGGEGLHISGTEEDGYYVVRNHEIDIELPSHLEGGTLSQPSLENMKCNTWRGELQNWSVDRDHPDYWEEYRDNLTPIGFNPADGQYHTYRFDWYHDRVEFYIDGVLKQVNTESIPDIAGYFTFGMWFPSSPIPEKPWLAKPDKAWAGGTVGADGGMKADFDQIEMRVRRFKYTPFIQEINDHQRKEAETYPFGGYRIYNKL